MILNLLQEFKTKKTLGFLAPENFSEIFLGLKIFNVRNFQISEHVGIVKFRALSGNRISRSYQKFYF